MENNDWTHKATPLQLAQWVDQAGAAPFVEDLLEVDASLWGNFWQGDVIAPGYRLPAIELALLRAIRLDETWPEETDVTQFLADLHQAITDPQAGIWTLAAAGEMCIVFASLSSQISVVSGQKAKSGLRSVVSGHSLATVAWYCPTTERLHAGYRTAIASLNFKQAVEQRRLQLPRSIPRKAPNQPDWLAQIQATDETAGRQPSAVGGRALAAQLDAAILRLRAQKP